MSSKDEKFKEIISKTIIPLQNDIFIKYIIGKNNFIEVPKHNYKFNIQKKKEISSSYDETNLKYFGDIYYENNLLQRKIDIVIHELMKPIINIYQKYSEFLYFYQMFKYIESIHKLNNYEYFAISNRNIIKEKANKKQLEMNNVAKKFNIKIKYSPMHIDNMLANDNKYIDKYDNKQVNIISKIFGHYRDDFINDYVKMLLIIHKIIKNSKKGSNFITYYKFRLKVELIMDLVTLYSNYFEHTYIYTDKYTTNKIHFTLILLNKNKDNIPDISDSTVHRLFDDNVIEKHYSKILNKLYKDDNKLREIMIALTQLKFMNENYYNMVKEKLSHMKKYVNVTTRDKIDD